MINSSAESKSLLIFFDFISNHLTVIQAAGAETWSWFPLSCVGVKAAELRSVQCCDTWLSWLGSVLTAGSLPSQPITSWCFCALCSLICTCLCNYRFFASFAIPEISITLGNWKWLVLVSWQLSVVLEHILQSFLFWKTNDSSCKCTSCCRFEIIGLKSMSEEGWQLFQPIFQFLC